MREWNFSAEILPQVMPLFFNVQVSQSGPANQQSLELAEHRSSNTTGTSSQQSQTDIDAPSLEDIGGKKPQGQGQNGKQSGANTNVAAKPPATNRMVKHVPTVSNLDIPSLGVKVQQMSTVLCLNVPPATSWITHSSSVRSITLTPLMPRKDSQKSCCRAARVECR
jgi:hypothetical protein